MGISFIFDVLSRRKNDANDCIGRQVFLLLILEIVVFVGLIIPLPFHLKRRMFTFISESPVIAKLQHGMRVGAWSNSYHSSSVTTANLQLALDHIYLYLNPIHR
jgi:Bap31/Bap29 transmembrane region